VGAGWKNEEVFHVEHSRQPSAKSPVGGASAFLDDERLVPRKTQKCSTWNILYWWNCMYICIRIL